MTNLMKIIANGTIVAALAAAALPASAETSVNGSCAKRNASAALVSTAPISTPDIAQIYHLSGPALVQVDLDETGKAQAASIVKSSGWAVLDAAAQSAVLAQNYAPEIRECQAVGGTYRVAVVF